MTFLAGQRVTAANLNTLSQLITKTVLSGSVSSVSFGSIPQTFTNLRLVISAKSDGTGTNGYDPAVLQFNGVATGVYSWNTWWVTQGAGALSTTGGTTATSMQCAEIWNSHFVSAGRGIATIEIPNYADVNNLKSFTSQSTATDGGAAGILQTYGGCLSGTTVAITSLTVLMGTGNFIADSTFCLYGM